MNTIVEKLWKYGYFFCSEVVNLYKVTEKDLNCLSLDDEVVKIALKHYQDMFRENLNELTSYYHGRKSITDGVSGPATVDLLNQPRCAHPDYYSANKEEARFPDSCRESISTSYRMNLSGMSSETLERLWKKADQNWADVLNVNFSLQLNNYPNTNIHSSEAALGGSILADQFLSNGRCGDRLRGRFDNRTWSERLFLATCTHEHGHALGLGHLNDRSAIMYPSIHSEGMNRGGTPNSSDISAMVRIGYRRRTSPPPNPDPPDNPKDCPDYKILTNFTYKGEKLAVVQVLNDGGGDWKIG